jgi:hypothetical protein
METNWLVGAVNCLLFLNRVNEKGDCNAAVSWDLPWCSVEPEMMGAMSHLA